MNTHSTDPFDPTHSAALPRRTLLALGGLMAASALLQGCRSRRTAGLPGPLWPDKEPPPQLANRGSGIGSGPTLAQSEPTWYPPAQPGNVSHAEAFGRGLPVYPRASWTSATPRWGRSKPMNGVSRITVHHDALNAAGFSGQANAAHRLESIRRSHIARGNEWVDIGYHYIIDPDGRIWEGRPLRIEGAHVAETNDHNLGVMCMGNFNEHRPTSPQMHTLGAFLLEQMHEHNVPVSRVYTHQELKRTECPGKHLQSHMAALRQGSGQLARA